MDRIHYLKLLNTYMYIVHYTWIYGAAEVSALLKIVEWGL